MIGKFAREKSQSFMEFSSKPREAGIAVLPKPSHSKGSRVD